MDLLWQILFDIGLRLVSGGISRAASKSDLSLTTRIISITLFLLTLACLLLGLVAGLSLVFTFLMNQTMTMADWCYGFHLIVLPAVNGWLLFVAVARLYSPPALLAYVAMLLSANLPVWVVFSNGLLSLSPLTSVAIWGICAICFALALGLWTWARMTGDD